MQSFVEESGVDRPNFQAERQLSLNLKFSSVFVRMARTKTPPTSTAPRPTRKSKQNPSKPVVVNYQKKKNDWLLGELGRRGVARPADVVKKNVVAALQQDDKDKAAASPPRAQTGAGVSKASKGKATVERADVRTRPRTSLIRLQLLQEGILDILSWVLAENEDRLDPIIRALGHANVELGRVMAPYWRLSLPDPPNRRAMSLGAPSQDPTAQNTRAASVGDQPKRTSPLLPLPETNVPDGEPANGEEEEVVAAVEDVEEGDEVQEDDQEEQGEVQDEQKEVQEEQEEQEVIPVSSDEESDDDDVASEEG